ncbi:MAG: hypothetical protein ACOVS5_16875, partial [Oligoflexus sp.]
EQPSTPKKDSSWDMRGQVPWQNPNGRRSMMKFQHGQWRKSWRLFFLGVITLSLSACFHGRKSPEERAKAWSEKAADRFDLNDAQRAQSQAIAIRMAQLGEGLKMQHKRLHEQLQEQLRADKVDAAALTETLRTSLRQIDEELPKLTQQFAELHSTLNSEQKGELQEILDRVGKKW